MSHFECVSIVLLTGILAMLSGIGIAALFI